MNKQECEVCGKDYIKHHHELNEGCVLICRECCEEAEGEENDN